TGNLNNSGDTLVLRNRIGRKMDVLDYSDGGAFPVAADGGGVSLAKRAPGLSSGNPESWTSSPRIEGSPGEENFPDTAPLGAPVTLTAFGDTWTFNQSGIGRIPEWAQTLYSSGTEGWEAGPGIFAIDSKPPASPVGTVLNAPAAGVVTHYFQRAFEFAGDPAQIVLQLTPLLDDGAVVFLNGFEVARINLPAGVITGTTRALKSVGHAALPAPLTLPGNRLVSGTNILSVEVHQAAEPDSGALILVEEGGTIDSANNLARMPGAVAFAKDLLPGYPAIHNIPNLNNGTYGNGSSWIGNSTNSFCAINLGATPKTVRGIAWGRDNLATHFDRTLGTYTVQYTTTPNPGATTPDSAWLTIGSINYTGSGSSLFSVPSLRHRFNFAPVDATGVRLICPGNGIGSGACIDELELYSNPLPASERDVVFGARLVARTPLALPGAAPLLINEIGGSNDTIWQIELRNTRTD
ncbi:MAG: hypothetical protein V4710_13940, partial [Verrucomicrobiota bacterium]